ncbi:putative reverse transcriptase domain-containing protein [Tanacetum coccineum]|uniref:Reverse transcriptase domain-containing protein n=1 Tax=Tanacetum coccineum TaxID=301880 RepID=A0ABQ4ZAG9_9ASTR
MLTLSSKPLESQQPSNSKRLQALETLGLEFWLGKSGYCVIRLWEHIPTVGLTVVENKRCGERWIDTHLLDKYLKEVLSIDDVDKVKKMYDILDVALESKFYRFLCNRLRSRCVPIHDCISRQFLFDELRDGAMTSCYTTRETILAYLRSDLGNWHQWRATKVKPGKRCKQKLATTANTSGSGTEGVVGLTQWFEKMESVFSISNCIVACQVKFATCTLQENALTWWNFTFKGDYLLEDAYANAMENVEEDDDRQHSCRKKLMNKRKLDNNNQTQQQLSKRQNVAQAYAAGTGERKEYAGTLPLCNKSSAATNNQRTLTCYECGNQGHYRSNCPELKNRNHGNQAEGTEARGMEGPCRAESSHLKTSCQENEFSNYIKFCAVEKSLDRQSQTIKAKPCYNCQVRRNSRRAPQSLRGNE